jgi:hypothetical protein
MRKPRGNGSSPHGPRGSGVAGLFVVPRLEELAVDPSRAGVLDTRTARIVATQALGIFMASFCRLLEAGGADNLSDEAGQVAGWRDGPSNSSRILPELDDVVSVEEIARILGKPRRWIIRNASRLPFVTRVSRKHYVCSRTVLRRWLASRPRALKDNDGSKP